MSYLVRILLVEDHDDTAEAYRTLLMRRGYFVHVARNVADAKAAAVAQEFDLLICDLVLPDGDGCELCRELREASGIGAIALTACGYPADFAKTKAAGFRSHLLKPVSLDVLIAAVESVVQDPSGAVNRRESSGACDEKGGPRCHGVIP